MTNTLKYTLFFAGGLLAGFGAGYVSAKMVLEKRYDKLFQDGMRDMEEYYQRTDSYRREPDAIYEDDAEINPTKNTNTDRSKGVLSDDARDDIKEKLAEIREKLVDNYERTSNYASIYSEKHPESSEGGEGVSSELLRDEDDEIEDEALKATLEHHAHKNDPPRIISEEEFGDLPPHIDTSILYFYHDDETVIDDNDDVIEDPAVLVGDTLNNFIDDINNPVMFVFNPALDTAYEIQRVEGAYYNG